VRAERSIVVLDGSSHTDVVTEEDSQFVVVSLRTQGNIDTVDAARRTTLLVIDGQRYSVADYAFPPHTEHHGKSKGDTFDVAFQLPLDLNASESEVYWKDDDDDRSVAVWRTPPAVI